MSKLLAAWIRSLRSGVRPAEGASGVSVEEAEREVGGRDGAGADTREALAARLRAGALAFAGLARFMLALQAFHLGPEAPAAHA